MLSELLEKFKKIEILENSIIQIINKFDNDQEIKFQTAGIEEYLNGCASQFNEELILWPTVDEGSDLIVQIHPQFKHHKQPTHNFNQISFIHENLYATASPTPCLGHSLDKFYHTVHQEQFQHMIVLYTLLDGEAVKWTPNYFIQPEYTNSKLTVNSSEIGTVQSDNINQYQLTFTNNIKDENITENHALLLDHIYRFEDEGVPELNAGNIEYLYQLLKNIDQTKTLIHCTAGVGRSGLLLYAFWLALNIDALLNAGTEAHYAILKNALLEIRKQRLGSVAKLIQLQAAISLGVALAKIDLLEQLEEHNQATQTDEELHHQFSLKTLTTRARTEPPNEVANELATIVGENDDAREAAVLEMVERDSRVTMIGRCYTRFGLLQGGRSHLEVTPYTRVASGGSAVVIHISETLGTSPSILFVYKNETSNATLPEGFLTSHGLKGIETINDPVSSEQKDEAEREGVSSGVLARQEIYGCREVRKEQIKREYDANTFATARRECLEETNVDLRECVYSEKIKFPLDPEKSNIIGEGLQMISDTFLFIIVGKQAPKATAGSDIAKAEWCEISNCHTDGSFTNNDGSENRINPSYMMSVNFAIRQFRNWQLTQASSNLIKDNTSPLLPDVGDASIQDELGEASLMNHQKQMMFCAQSHEEITKEFLSSLQM